MTTTGGLGTDTGMSTTTVTGLWCGARGGDEAGAADGVTVASEPSGGVVAGVGATDGVTGVLGELAVPDPPLPAAPVLSVEPVVPGCGTTMTEPLGGCTVPVRYGLAAAWWADGETTACEPMTTTLTVAAVVMATSDAAVTIVFVDVAASAEGRCNAAGTFTTRHLPLQLGRAFRHGISTH